jgi:hypothetical protein
VSTTYAGFNQGPFNLTREASILCQPNRTERLSLTKPVEFLNDWEADFARLLDERRITWQYKPRTFAVEWDDEGNFVDSFTPDFYLPDLELFVQLFVRGCRTDGEKGQKVRLLHQIHPEIRIELLGSESIHSIFRDPLLTVAGRERHSVSW